MTKYAELADRLEQQIRGGAFRSGAKLPSIRQLCLHHKLAKNTVIHALHLLERRGMVVAQAKRGFVVTQQHQISVPEEPVFDNIQPARVSIPDLLQDVILRGAAFDIKPSEAPSRLPPLLSTLHRMINKAMRTQAGRKAFYYDEPLGSGALREQLAALYMPLGLACSPQALCITNGCQHGLFLALMATCKPGDNVVIESPGFYGVIQLLDQLGLSAIEVPSHSETGLNIEVLASVLASHPVAACVVSPSFSTPTGACMPDQNKQALIALANQHQLAIIEDDIYGDLGFASRPVPLKVSDTEDRVILCSSFSKTLSRDIRLGWIIGGRWHRQITQLKLVSQLSCNQSVQAGCTEFLAEGHYKRYLRQTSQTLQRHQQQLLNGLQRIWGSDIRVSQPKGGLSLWAELPQGSDSLMLYGQALTRGIVLTPGALFSVNRDFSRFIRLSFSHPLTPGREKALSQLHSLVINGQRPNQPASSRI